MIIEKPDWIADSTTEDQWQTASLDGPIIKQLEKTMSVMGHMVEIYAKDAEKQIRTIRKL